MPVMLMLSRSLTISEESHRGQGVKKGKIFEKKKLHCRGVRCVLQRGSGILKYDGFMKRQEKVGYYFELKNTKNLTIRPYSNELP